MRKTSLFLQVISELFGVFWSEVDYPGLTETHLTENFGILSQPIFLGRRLHDVVEPHESNPRPTCDQSIYGIGDLTLT